LAPSAEHSQVASLQSSLTEKWMLLGYICKYIEIDFISTNVSTLTSIYYRSEIDLIIYQHLIDSFYDIHSRVLG